MIQRAEYEKKDNFGTKDPTLCVWFYVWMCARDNRHYFDTKFCLKISFIFAGAKLFDSGGIMLAIANCELRYAVFYDNIIVYFAIVSSRLYSQEFLEV